MGSVVSVVLSAVSYAAGGPFGSLLGLIATAGSVAMAFFGSGKKKDSGTDTTSDHKLTVKSTVESRKIIYGEMMVSGPLVLKTTTGSTKEYLHLVVPLAAHRVTEFLET